MDVYRYRCSGQEEIKIYFVGRENGFQRLKGKKKKTSTQSPAHNLLSERTDCCCCFLPPDLFSKQKVLIFFFHSVLISTSANELSATEFKLPWSTILSDRKKWIYIEGGGKTKIKYVARLISKEKKKYTE